MSDLMTAPVGGVSVRMYRKDLGDCFLLAFGSEQGPRYVLIDCGIVLGSSDRTKKLQAILHDVREATGGHLHVLAVTHEHYDHLSGFEEAKAELAQFVRIDQLWLSWLEDPQDEVAKKVRQGIEVSVTALGAAYDMMQANAAKGVEHTGRTLALKSLLELYGPLGARSVRSTIQALKDHPNLQNPIRYCQPGQEPLGLPDVEGLRIYVLGPPRNTKQLYKSNPSSGSKSEVYPLADGIAGILGPSSGFMARVAAADMQLQLDLPDNPEGDAMPFEARWRKPFAQAIQDEFFATHYGDPNDSQHEEAWRQIEDDWLGASESLALAIDNNRNNSSLVLAFELPDGRVLLFPGDAQVGNWLSWFNPEVHWQVKDGGETREVDAQDLLSRTVLYKVGHHGSHNATLREQGLERMTHPGLMAMVPVVEATAKKIGWGEMPLPSLVQRLEQKTRGRVLRSDNGIGQGVGLSASERVTYEQAVHETDLYLEITIEAG
jgi:hypothetical protein